MSHVKLVKELQIQTLEEVGVASQLVSLIGQEAKINIRSLYGGVMDGHGFFSIVTEDNDKVRELLEGTSFSLVKEEEVLVVPTPDVPGACAEVANKLAEAGININYLFTTIFDSKTSVVLSAVDNQKALSLFT